MKFKPGIIQNLSGSMGATTFVNSRYGSVMRKKTIPVNRWSESRYQSEIRLVNTTRLWANVTPPQHKVWVEFAKGFTRVDKAKNIVPCRTIDIFKMLARNMVEINEPVFYDAPKKIYPEAFKSIDVEIIGTDILEDIKLHFEPAIPPDVKYKVFATAMLRKGVFFVKPCWYRKIAVLDSTFLSGSSIFKEYLAVFQNYGMRISHIGFMFIPVSTISGLTSTEIEVLAYQP